MDHFSPLSLPHFVGESSIWTISPRSVSHISWESQAFGPFLPAQSPTFRGRVKHLDHFSPLSLPHFVGESSIWTLSTRTVSHISWESQAFGPFLPAQSPTFRGRVKHLDPFSPLSLPHFVGESSIWTLSPRSVSHISWESQAFGPFLPAQSPTFRGRVKHLDHFSPLSLPHFVGESSIWTLSTRSVSHISWESQAFGPFLPAQSPTFRGRVKHLDPFSHTHASLVYSHTLSGLTYFMEETGVPGGNHRPTASN